MTLAPEDERTLDSLGEAYLAETKVPGMAVGFLCQGKIMYTRGFGVKSLDTQDPVTPQSVFHTASVSKTFVATAAAILIEEEKLSLDDKIVDILPYFEMRDERYREITVQDMLTHTSGMPDLWFYHWRNPRFGQGEDALENYVRSGPKQRLRADAKTDWHYSNLAFDIMGDVIAKASGMPFEEFVKTRILLPAGMEASTFFAPEIDPALATTPHIRNIFLQPTAWKHYPYNRVHAGSSTLNANVDDLLRYALLYLNEGTSVTGNEVFSEETYRLLTTPQYRVGINYDIGLGWFLSPAPGSEDPEKNRDVIEHSGGDVGYGSFLSIITSEDYAFVILFNGYWPHDEAYHPLVRTGYEIAQKYAEEGE